jgi:hypothetical protein
LAAVFLVAVAVEEAVEELKHVEEELEARNKKDRDFDY